jgi:AcrR family transcriptional regulator
VTHKPPRRTQAERKQATVARLMEAATEVLIELGYSSASVQRICERAELSQGALFRHFPTTDALFIALGQHVGAQLMERYRRRFAAFSPREATLENALVLLQQTCRSKLNQAWYELALAARTNPGLQKALQPVASRYYADIAALAAHLVPPMAEAHGDAFPVLVRTVLGVFDADVVQRVAGRSAEEDAQQVAVLASAVSALTISASRGKRATASRGPPHRRPPLRRR